MSLLVEKKTREIWKKYPDRHNRRLNIQAKIWAPSESTHRKAIEEPHLIGKREGLRHYFEGWSRDLEGWLSFVRNFFKEDRRICRFLWIFIGFFEERRERFLSRGWWRFCGRQRSCRAGGVPDPSPPIMELDALMQGHVGPLALREPSSGRWQGNWTDGQLQKRKSWAILGKSWAISESLAQEGKLPLGFWKSPDSFFTTWLTWFWLSPFCTFPFWSY